MSHIDEPDAVVYNLGHYEQMQIDLALQILRDSINSDGSVTIHPGGFAHLDTSVIANLQTLFGPYGVVSIIRTADRL